MAKISKNLESLRQFALRRSLLIGLILTNYSSIYAQSLNEKIVDYVTLHGKKISPTYEHAVCTELVIKVLEHFTPLTKEDKNRIRIIVDENIHVLRVQKREEPKGVFYALTSANKGEAINTLEQVVAGDFVQFWYTGWGHCGIVKEIDMKRNVMTLFSSFPATEGFGVQEFVIPTECYFVRLKVSGG